MSAFTPSTYSHPASSQAPPTQSFLSSSSSSNLAQSSSQVASQAYAQLCKVVLGRRNRNMLTLTGTAAFAALYIGTFDPRGLPRSLFNILPILLFSPFAFLASLPIIVLRKKTLTTARPPLPTRFAQFAQLRERSSLWVLLAYLISSSILLVTYVSCAPWVSRDAKLDFFFFHEGRDSWQLNERRVLLALLHTFLGVFGMVQHVFNDRSQVHFDDDTSLTIPARLSAKASQRVPAAFRSAFTAVMTFWTGYVLLRRPVLRFFLVHVAGSWARPYLWSMMRFNGAYSITLAARALSFATLHFLLWEATNVCFEVYATHPMTVSQFGSHPNQALLSGLRSKDSYYQQFAYLELARLTLTDPKRREAIFRDVKPGSAVGGAWNELSRECLLLIGTELQRAKGRGSLPKPAQSPASSSSAPSFSQQQRQSSPNRAPVKNEPIFLSTKPTFFDKLASAAVSSGSPTLGASPAGQAVSSALHGPTAKEATQAVSTALAATSSVVSRVPSILQGSSLASDASSQEGEQKNGSAATSANELQPEQVPQVFGVEQRIARFVPAQLRTKLFAVGMENRARRCVPKRRVTVCAIQALSNLICASLTEDPYGVAQRDIPKILEAFVRYISVLDSLESELTELAERTPGGQDEREKARKVVEKEVGEVQEALRAGTKAVLTEFSDYLGEFRFPTSVAAQLQQLVDYGA
ncbi:hypothetical protein JCM11251_004420 [Rhodosporidiobolus azoricus]